MFYEVVQFGAKYFFLKSKIRIREDIFLEVQIFITE
jgi:hypothetical protein